MAKDRLLEVLEPYGVLEMARTGLLAMARGEGATAAAADRGAVPADEPQSDIAYSV